MKNLVTLLILAFYTTSSFAFLDQSQFSTEPKQILDKTSIIQNQKQDNRDSHIFKSNHNKVPPVNDDICNAIELINGAPPVIGDNREATLEPGEPIGNCHFQGDPADSTVWYYFVVDSAQKDYVVTTNLAVLTNDDTQLTGYSSTGGCSGILSQIACNDDVAPGLLSLITVSNTSIGDTVWVQVDGWSGTTGTFEIQLYSTTAAVAPANDNICNAQELIVGASPTIGDNTNASSEVNEPIGSCYSDGPVVDVSVWFYFVPSFTGSFIVTTDLNVLGNNDTQLAAYSSTGGCAGPFTELACNDDIDLPNQNYLSTISLPGILAGDTIWLQVDGWFSQVGNFEIQVTGTPAPSHDAAIEPTSIFSTGLAGYSLVPFSQNDPGTFMLDVSNYGQDSISSVNVTGIISPGGAAVSANTPLISAFSTQTLSTTSFAALNPSTLYSANFNVSIAETDSNSSNDSEVYSFTSGALSDSVFALENTISPSLQFGSNGGTARFGNRFEFTSSDTITSITVAFTTPGGTNYELEINGFDPSTNSTTSILWNSGPIPVPASGFHSYSVNLPVTPGTYLVSILQTDVTFLAAARTDVFQRPKTSYFGDISGTGLSTMEDGGFASTFIIRANMNTALNQPPALSAFDLLSPPSGSRLALDSANLGTPVTIEWETSSTSAPGTVMYEWLLDFQGGDFSTPLASIQSDNGGQDTTLTLSYGFIDTLLSNLGIPYGDSLDVIWTVKASLAASSLTPSNGPFDLNLVRGIVSGIAETELSSKVVLYPNPTSGQIFIADDHDIVESIKVVDLMGREVKRQSGIGRKIKIDLSQIHIGIYLLHIITAEGDFVKKIILE